MAFNRIHKTSTIILLYGLPPSIPQGCNGAEIKPEDSIVLLLPTDVSRGKVPCRRTRVDLASDLRLESFERFVAPHPVARCQPRARLELLRPTDSLRLPRVAVKVEAAKPPLCSCQGQHASGLN
jgi:hypothetical protein